MARETTAGAGDPGPSGVFYGVWMVLVAGIVLAFMVMASGFLVSGSLYDTWAIFVAVVLFVTGWTLAGSIGMAALVNQWFANRLGTALGLRPCRRGWRLGHGRSHRPRRVPGLAGPLLYLRRLVPGGHRCFTASGPRAARGSGDAPRRCQSRSPDSGHPARAGLPGSGRYEDVLVFDGRSLPARNAGHGDDHVLTTDHGVELSDLSLITRASPWITTASYDIGGLAGDRTPKNRALLACAGLQALATFMVIGAPGTCAAAMVLAYVSLGARANLIVAVLGDYFGRSSFGRLLGLSFLVSGIFGQGSFWLLALPDRVGTGALLAVFGVFAVIGAALYLMARRPEFPSATDSAAL